LGGENVYLPKKMPVENRDENIKKEFRELLYAGATCMSGYAALAKKYSLSARRIIEIANR
jgi:Mor family transcriptional regulator